MFKNDVFIVSIYTIGCLILTGIAYSKVAWWLGILVGAASVYGFVKVFLPKFK